MLKAQRFKYFIDLRRIIKTLQNDKIKLIKNYLVDGIRGKAKMVFRGKNRALKYTLKDRNVET